MNTVDSTFMDGETLSAIVDAVVEELDRAEKKWPYFPVDPLHACAIIVEEVGEMVREANRMVYEADDEGTIDTRCADMKQEAIQSIVTLFRLLAVLPQIREYQRSRVKQSKTCMEVLTNE